MAVSTWTADSGANAFTIARINVPTGEMPIADRFKAIQAIADEARSDGTMASLDALSLVVAALPTSLVTRISCDSRRRHSTSPRRTCAARPSRSSSPAPSCWRTTRSARSLGTAFNLTLLSYLGSLDMGVNIDAGAVAEPERLAAHLDQSFKDLRKA